MALSDTNIKIACLICAQRDDDCVSNDDNEKREEKSKKKSVEQKLHTLFGFFGFPIWAWYHGRG